MTLRLLAVTLAVGAVFSTSGATIESKDGVDICRVRQPVSDGAPDDVRVIAMPGNSRAVAFGDMKGVETTVACMGNAGDGSSILPPGCAAWPEDREPVTDVSQCPDCPCVQDTANSLSASNSLMFSAGVGPACAQARAGAPVDVLLFGLGGGAVQTYAAQHCPENTRVESVEADPRMAAIATKFFGVPVRDGTFVVDVDDASKAAAALSMRLSEAEAQDTETADDEAEAAKREDAIFAKDRSKVRTSFLSIGQKEPASVSTASEPELGKRRWDVVVTDCFVDKGVTPESCRSREFLSYVRNLVRGGGTVLQHLWHTSPYDDTVAGSFEDTVQLYKNIFGEDQVSIEKIPRDESIAWDSIVVARA